MNLVLNSIYEIQKLNDQWIKIKAFHNSQNQLVIQIIDSGDVSKITPEIEEKLFQPFYTTKPPSQGTGLGLPISKGIIEEHKGTLELIRSEKNTCFEIKLPQKLSSPSKEKKAS